MPLSDHFLGVLGLGSSVAFLLYLFFLLMLSPVLPLDENIFEIYTPPHIILMSSGIFGLVFIGSLSIFTFIILKRYRQKNRNL